MWVECESGELLNLDRADKIVISRDHLIIAASEPEQWVDLGVICSLIGVDEDERKAIRERFIGLLDNSLGDVIRYREFRV